MTWECDEPSVTHPHTLFTKSGDVTIAYQVVGSGIAFAEEAVEDLKGVPGTWTLYSVTG